MLLQLMMRVESLSSLGRFHQILRRFNRSSGIGDHDGTLK